MVRDDLGVQESTAIIDAWGMTDEGQRQMYLDAIPKQHRMLLTAGSLILPLFRQNGPLLKPDSLSSLNGFASMWCCIENMLLAAAAEGIYGVTRIPFDQEIAHLKQTLSIPGDYEIACYLALGYPAKNRPALRQTPADARHKIHINRW
jgi:nitroreductase